MYSADLLETAIEITVPFPVGPLGGLRVIIKTLIMIKGGAVGGGGPIWCWIVDEDEVNEYSQKN